MSICERSNAGGKKSLLAKGKVVVEGKWWEARKLTYCRLHVGDPSLVLQ